MNTTFFIRPRLYNSSSKAASCGIRATAPVITMAVHLLGGLNSSLGSTPFLTGKIKKGNIDNNSNPENIFNFFILFLEIIHK